LSFANFAMRAAHEVNAAREPINVAEKQQQLISRLSRKLQYIRVSNVSAFNMPFFR